MKLSFRRPASMHIEVEQLSAYLDGQLALAERARVESHLQGCAACARELESLRRTVALVQALPRVPVPRAFTLSEAQVGIRQRRAQGAWSGGLLRGLGVATAFALVAVVAAVVLRQPAWAPSATVAREAPSAASLTQEAAPAAAPAIARAPEQPQALSVETATVEQAAAATVAVETTAEQAAAAPTMTAMPPAARMVIAPPTEMPSAKAAAPAPTATAEQAMIALAPPAPEAAPALSAAAASQGGGDSPVDGAIPAEALTPEPTPPLRPLNEVLPAGIRLAYADLKGIWAIDREQGARQLAQVEGANTPQVSPDGQLILYRSIAEGSNIELWVASWDGAKARRLLSERDLPKTDLGRQYVERRIQDTRWVPGQSLIALNLVAVPAPAAAETPVRTELWYLDAGTGALHYVTDLGNACCPVFSPQGDRFALLRYGTEADPQGTLTLFDLAGINKRVALRFPASPAKVSYERQLAWSADGQTLWLALPDADPPGPGQLNGTTLYRVPVTGEAQVAGHVDAYQVAWSPDARRLLFTRYTSDVMDTMELYLADGDGAAPQRYATVRYGEFVNWAPDGEHFVYQDNYQVYVGSPDAAPQRLGNGVSLVDLRWVSAAQFVSKHDIGSGWLLTLRGLDGSAAGLLPLPREAMVDVSHP